MGARTGRQRCQMCSALLMLLGLMGSRGWHRVQAVRLPLVLYRWRSQVQKAQRRLLHCPSSNHWHRLQAAYFTKKNNSQQQGMCHGLLADLYRIGIYIHEVI